MSNVSADLLCRGALASNGISYDQVYFARICLHGNIVDRWKSELLAKKRVEFVAFGSISLENF